MRSGTTQTPEKSKGSGEVNTKKLILPLALEDGRVPGFLANLSFAACTLIGAAVIWAYLTEIRELALGQGEIVPMDSVKNVHFADEGHDFGPPSSRP